MKTFKSDISTFGGSLTTLVPFLIEQEFAGNVGFQGQAKTGVPRKKPLGEKKTNHKLDQHMGSFLKKELQGKKEGITGINYTTNVPNADMTTVQTTPPQYKEA